MNDIARLREEYKDRERRLFGSDIYSLFNLSHLFVVQQRQRALLTSLKRHGLTDISKFQVLEMGCGNGGVLAEFLNFGGVPSNLYGVDLLIDQLIVARQRLPVCHFFNADGQSLPFPSQSFDLVMQFTALSSILDPNLRQKICKDMLRVLKPSGLILWYDFWLNPTNPQTHGIRPAEIRRLFPDCRFDFQRVTLAPPITRRLVPVSWLLCAFLEKLKIFNTHYLVAITKVPPNGGVH